MGIEGGASPGVRPPGWSDAGTEGRRTLPGVSSAAKVIDWNGRDVPEALPELLRELPPGQYTLERVLPAEEAWAHAGTGAGHSAR